MVPVPERVTPGHDGYGAHCGLGDPGFAAWTCAAGLTCRGDFPRVAVPDVGECLPATSVQSGDPCDPGRLVDAVEAADDTYLPAGITPGRLGICATGANGFPGGAWGGVCTMNLSKDEVCAQAPILGPFTACLERGTAFHECFEKYSAPAALRTCTAEEACRDDYICMARGSMRSVCVPTYVLQQLSIEHHQIR